MSLQPGRDQRQRGEALRTRVMVANALCAITESQLQSGEAARATASIKAIRGIVAEIAALACEPDHLSSGAARELSEVIGELERRLVKMETALPQDKASG